VTETAKRGARARAAFAHRDFRRYVAARFLVTVGLQMQSVAVGWQVYAITHNPLHLGWIGLAQFLPLVVLGLGAGHAADRLERRRIAVACMVLFSAGAALLSALSLRQQPSLAAIYAVVVLLGAGRAFHGPAVAALLPQLVPASDFPNAVAWSSSSWQAATVVGPALGGFLYGGVGPAVTYALTGALVAVAAVLLAGISRRAAAYGLAPRPAAPSPETSAGGAQLGAAPTPEPRHRALLAGLSFVWREKLILGSIALDLFAVLLGGAVALLPALARDVLDVGPWGLGIMRGSPALGAAATALYLAFRPLERRVGWVMLCCVFLFGTFTVGLGLSRSFALSVAALVGLGAADMISVFVRQNLVQLSTPDAMRGRVSAVNLVFIGASNELGEFESGLTAAWFGTRAAIVAGGLGTCVVVLLWAWLFPALRRVDRLSELQAKAGSLPASRP